MRLATRLAAAGIAALASAAGLALPARAGEHYVDAALGLDVPSGGTLAQPWRTISYARTQVGGEGVTIHVAPGLYDAALGETFPIPMTGSESLVGAGWPSTVVDGGGAGELFVFASAPVGDPAEARLEGLTLRGFGTGMRFFASLPVGTPRLRGLRFEGLAVGLHLDCSLVTAEPAVEASTFARCGVGLLLTTTSTSPAPVLSECILDRCGTGVRVSAWSHPHSGFSTATARLVRSVIARCDLGVELLELDANSIARLEGCLVTGCREAIRYGGVSDAVLVRSTVSGNAAGLVVPPAPDNDVYTTLESSIVWGNGAASLDPAEGTYFGGYSDTDPPLPLPGCLGVAPGLVGTGPSGYRLSATSPLVDLGDPATPAAGTDFELDPRVLDGDGDGAARVDMGYDELNRTKLTSLGTPAPGATVLLVVRAPAGQVFALALALQTGDLYLPPFGSLLLDPGSIVLQLAGTSPGSVPLAIPPDPALAGLVLHGQALSLELPGAAVGSFSNRLDLVVEAERSTATAPAALPATAASRGPG